MAPPASGIAPRVHDLLDDGEQVEDRAGKPVDPRHRHHVAGGQGFQQLQQFAPVGSRAAHLFTENLGPPFGAAACRCTGYTGPARRPPRLLKQFLQAASLECPRMPWNFGNWGQNQSGSRTSSRRNYLAPLRWFPTLSRLVGYSPADAALCDGSPVRSARPANRRVAGRAQRPPRSATTAPTEGCPPPSPLSRDWG